MTQKLARRPSTEELKLSPNEILQDVKNKLYYVPANNDLGKLEDVSFHFTPHFLTLFTVLSTQHNNL